jgi:MFS family permease
VLRVRALPAIALRERLVVPVLALLLLVVVANNTSAIVAQPAIATEFGAGPADVGWVIFGYTAAFAVATTLYGGLAMRTSIDRLVAIGAGLLALGSLAAAIAPTLVALVGARLIQGFGAGALPTLASALIARRFTGAARARNLGIIVAAVAAGQALGPLAGGVLLEAAGWRAAVALGLVAAPAGVVAFALIVEPRGAPASDRLDGLGAVIAAAAAFSAVFAINRLPLLGLSPATFVTGAMAVGLCVVLSRRRPASGRPFLRWDVVASRRYGGLAPLSAAGVAAFLGVLVIFPLAMSSGHGLEGIRAGAMLVPMALAAAALSTNIARVQHRLGRPLTTAISLLSLSAAALLFALLGVDSWLGYQLVPLGLLGAGYGMLTSPLVNELSAVSGDPREQPQVIGTFYIVSFLGGATGGALATAVIQRGIEIGPLSGGPLPGYSTAALLLALAPGACGMWLWLQRPRAWRAAR